LLLLLIPFGALMGLASTLFVKGIYWAEDRFESLVKSDYVRHMSGMLVAGVLLYAMWQRTGRYYVEGIGYATIMDVLTGVLTNPAFLLLLCGLKLAATCLTLGSEGSGGVISPALFMGATLGSAFAHFAQWLLPGIEIDTVTFALAGMAAIIGASTGAMITAGVMLHEMTGDNNIMLPVIVSTVLACGVRKLISPGSIYTLKLLRRGHVVPEGLQAAMDDTRSVEHVMEEIFRVVEQGEEVEPFPGVTVVARDGRTVGVVRPFGSFAEPAGESVDRIGSFVVLGLREPLVEAMRTMQMAGTGCALVFSLPDSERIEDLVGVLTWREFSAYRSKLAELF
jgi:CIC family chloride channel protein